MSHLPQQLDVSLYGKTIGAITHLGGDQTIFAFNDDYANDAARPSLSLSFRDHLGGLIRTQTTTRTQLTPYFSNLLPKGPLLDYLAKLANVKPIQEYPLLAALGQDLPGAVVVQPASRSLSTNVKISQESNKKVAHNAALHFSLAGVQLKFSALEKANGRLTIPANGEGGSWIIKLPSLRFAGLADNEFSMMTLAQKIGIDVPEIKLISLDQVEGLPEGVERIKENAFAIRRFDRQANGDRIHTEDFAQVFGVYPQEKYSQASYRSIANVLWRESGAENVIEFIRRIVFMTLIGNADMHLKNWSLIYRDRITAELSPAYDFVSTIAYIPDDETALKFARTRKMTELTIDELRYLADKASLPRGLVLDTAQETVARFREIWDSEKTSLSLTNEAYKIIDKHVSRLPIAKSAKM